MISAWQVYLVLMIDDIKSLFTVAGVVGIIAAVGFSLILTGMRSDCYDHEGVKYKNYTANIKKGINWMKVALLSLCLGVLMPSTKVLAAMIILPALTSDKVIDPLVAETKELYTLAKDALKSAVSDGTTEPKKD